MQQSPRDVVVVLGMHRSGTSLCMQVLNHLGLQFDGDLQPGDENNSKGYFESRELVALNEHVLHCLGVTWRTLFSLAVADKWVDLPAVAMARDRIASLVSRKVQRSGTWAFKDPRLCVLLPLYEQVFADCGVEPRYVVCIRDPRSVALSLLRRDGLSQPFSELLWMENTIGAIQVGGKHIRAVVHYEDWFREGRRQLDWLMEGLGLRLNHEGSWASFLDSTLDRSLNHADAHTGSFALRCTESIYQLLLNGNYAGAIHRFGEIQRMRKRTSLAGTNDRAAP